MPLTVHHLHIGQSERIPWLCEELGIPYELKLHTRNPLMSPPELAALSPMKIAPVVEDVNPVTGESFNLTESGAIVEYIINIHGGGRLALKPDHPNYVDYLYWLHWSNASLQPSMARILFAIMTGVPKDGPVYSGVEGYMHKHLAALDARLKHTNAWLAGNDFTAADIMNVWCLTTNRQWCPVDLGQYEGILAYLKRVGARPAYIRTMDKIEEGLDWRKSLTTEGPSIFPGLIQTLADRGIDSKWLE